MALQIRRGLYTELPTLAEGEFGFCTDTHQLYLGSASGNILQNAGGGGGEITILPDGVFYFGNI